MKDLNKIEISSNNHKKGTELFTLNGKDTDDEPKCKQRNFGITKAYSVYQDNTSEYKRQNDIYIFCLNIGNTRETSNPLQLEHWEFYILPTKVIDKECGEAKSISLGHLRKMIAPCTYDEIKLTVDKLINDIKGD